MNDPIYLSRPDYIEIAKSALPEYDSLQQWQQDDAVDEAKRAHLEVHVGAIRDSDLTPRQLAFREAYKAFVAPKPKEIEDVTEPEKIPAKLVNDATPVTVGSKKKKL